MKLTSNGRIALPKCVRDRLGLALGGRLAVAVEGRRIILYPKTLHLDDICSLLPAPAQPVSVNEMDVLSGSRRTS
ncbi:MAG: AbrB/MazE/SpoVT family DNA-binding domain-containing protein [Candidatus Cybelea sp.]